MRLNRGDIVTLLKPLVIRSSFSVGTIPAGTNIEIQQVSVDSRKYLVSNEWIHYSVIENAI